MKLQVRLKNPTKRILANFGVVNNVSDGGYDRGYSEGYEEGYKVGYGESYDKGFVDGEKIEHDNFWDNYQKNGTRVDYQLAFCRTGWNDETFKPKYDIAPKGSDSATGMFQNSSIIDLKGCLEKQGVKLDTFNADGILQMFQSSAVKYIPEIDARNSTNSSYAFYSRSIVSIEKLIVSENTHFSVYVFRNADNLEKLIVEGTIGVNGFDVSYSKKLTHESVMSIITALKDFSGTGTTRTCTLGATNLAKLTAEEKVIANNKGWTLV